MRKWFKALGLLAGMLWMLGSVGSRAGAQFPPPGEYGPPPGDYGGAFGGPGGPPSGPPPKEPTDPLSIRDEGAPNAFTSQYDVRAPGLPPVLPSVLKNWLPFIFHQRPTAAVAAEFPNPAQGSCEPVTAFSQREEGISNAFTELCDPNPPGFLHRCLGQTRLLYTELLTGPTKFAECPVLSFRGEYLNWRVSAGPSAAVLLTTNNNFPVEVGALGQPNTVPLVNSGNDVFNYGNIPGFRLTMGINIGYLPPIEISGFSMNRTTTAFSGGSLTNPTQLLAIPIQDVSIPNGVSGFGTEEGFIVEAPLNSVVGGLGGAVQLTSSLALWGIEANAFLPVCDTDVFKADFLFGYRHIQLNETLQINTQTGGPVSSGVFFGGATPEPAGFTVSSLDSFGTRNQYDSGQIGARFLTGYGRFVIYSDLKLALGNNQETLNINGSSTLSQPVSGRASTTLPGGILALPSNSGTRTMNKFAVAPESNISIGYLVNTHVRIFAGLNFLYMSSVIRPGDAVNNVVDTRQNPTSPNYSPSTASSTPTFPGFVQRGFTAEGLFFGIEIGF